MRRLSGLPAEPSAVTGEKDNESCPCPLQGENGPAAELEEEFPSVIPFLPPMSNETLQVRAPLTLIDSVIREALSFCGTEHRRDAVNAPELAKTMPVHSAWGLS